MASTPQTPAAASLGFPAPQGGDLITHGDDAITKLGNLVAAELDLRDSRLKQIPPGDDLNNWTDPGPYAFWGTHYQTANSPSAGAGVLIIGEIRTSNGTASTTTHTALIPGFKPEIWTRFKSRTWSAWTRVDGPGAVDAALARLTPPVPPPPAAQTAWRTVPLSLTVSGSYKMWSGPLAGGVRIPLRFGATIRRWRVHFRDVTTRFTDERSSAAQVSIGYVGFGRRSGDRLLDSSNVDADRNTSAPGEEIVTPWQTREITADQDWMLGFTYSINVPTISQVGGGWTTAIDEMVTDTPGTRTANLPLDVWIEAEVDPTVPVIAAYGDSLSSGVGATIPVFDSWVSQWCRTNAALPMHFTGSGYGMDTWDDDAWIWRRWEHLDRPDSVVFAMGSNDVFGKASLGTLQSWHKAAADRLRRHVSPVIYGATILPRDNVTGAAEDTRRAYNAWLKSSAGLRQVFDIVPALSTDDESLIASYAADSVHLNTSGYAQIAGVIPRSVLPEQLAADDTDWITLPNAGSGSARTGGTVQIRRVGNLCTARFDGATLEPGDGAAILIRGTELPPLIPAPQAGSIAWVGNSMDSNIAHLLRWNTTLWWIRSELGGSTSTTRNTATSLTGEITWTIE